MSSLYVVSGLGFSVKARKNRLISIQNQIFLGSFYPPPLQVPVGHISEKFFLKAQSVPDKAFNTFDMVWRPKNISKIFRKKFGGKEKMSTFAIPFETQAV